MVLVLEAHEQHHLECLRFMPRLKCLWCTAKPEGLSLDLGALPRTLQFVSVRF